MLSYMSAVSRRSIESGSGCNLGFYSYHGIEFYSPGQNDRDPRFAYGNDGDPARRYQPSITARNIAVGRLPSPQVLNYPQNYKYRNSGSDASGFLRIKLISPPLPAGVGAAVTKQAKRSYQPDNAPDPAHYLGSPFSISDQNAVPSPAQIQYGNTDLTLIPANNARGPSPGAVHDLHPLNQHIYPDKHFPIASPNQCTAKSIQVIPLPTSGTYDKQMEAKKIRIDTENLRVGNSNSPDLISPLSPTTESDLVARTSGAIAMLVMVLWEEEEGLKLCGQVPYRFDPTLTRFSLFANFLIRASRIPFCAVVLALKYLIRLSKLKSKIPAKSPLLSHRFPKKAKYSPAYVVLVVVLILANKYCDDYKVKNSYWSTLTFIQLGVINRAEFDSLKALSYSLYVDESEYADTSLTLSLVSKCYNDLDNHFTSSSSPRELAAATQRLIAVFKSLK